MQAPRPERSRGREDAEQGEAKALSYILFHECESCKEEAEIPGDVSEAVHRARCSCAPESGLRVLQCG